MCQKDLGNDDKIEIGWKEAEAVGTTILKSCRINFVSKNNIERHKRAIINRQKVSALNIMDQTQVDYRLMKHTWSSIKFQSLHILNIMNHSINILRELSFNIRNPSPNWQGYMHVDTTYVLLIILGSHLKYFFR
ncbi:hypothetical protein PR048_011735 [Dryococelus australis]|uniref:Uncharacterized protein n=1 Tax=Dryococelus australis TaxID=614101 RepID=A0ABQ9HMH9_9NEOP|nr:hypothetical protein PR048_011735 [Dryococelus australis]